MASVLFGQRVLTITAATATLSGCGFSGGVPVTGGSAPSRAAAMNTSSSNLLYVANGRAHDGVSILTFPGGESVATITKIGTPRGVCSNSAGEVYITAGLHTGRSAIYEFAAGATTPTTTVRSKATLGACAADPKTGDIAIVQLIGKKRGAIQVLPASLSGTPAVVYTSFRPVACAYDNSGDLYVDGTATGVSFELAELLYQSKHFTAIKNNRSARWSAGDIAWDGKHVTVGVGFTKNSAAKTLIYRLDIQGDRARVKEAVHLHDVSADPWYAIYGKQVVATRASGKSSIRRVALWAYPAGGREAASFKGFYNPTAIAISAAAAK